MKRAVVTGGSHGLGSHIVAGLKDSGFEVIDWSLSTRVDVALTTSVIDAAREIEGKVDILVNNAGINHLRWMEDMTIHDLRNVMRTNVDGIFNCTHALLENLKDGGTVLNITSVAGHVPMTCSLAYNTSKAAANMMTRQMARELFPKHSVTVFGVAPSKLSGTRMSDYVDRTVPSLRGWTDAEATAYQAKSLGTGREIPVARCAEFITWLLTEKERHEYLNGCILPYGL